MTEIALPARGARVRWPLLSLRWRVVMITFLAALVAFPIGARLFHDKASEERHGIIHRASEMTVLAETAFNREVVAASYLLQGLSKSPSLIAGDYRTFHDQLVATPKPDGSWITLWDHDGQVLNTLRPYGASLPRLSAWTGGGAAWDRVRDRRVSVSNRSFSPLAGSHVVAVGVRVDDAEGRMKGLLTSIIPEASLNAAVRNDIHPDGWVTTVFDREQVPVASSTDDRNLMARAMPQALRERLADPDGRDGGTGHDDPAGTFFAYRRSASGFVTVTAIPVALMDAPILDARRRIAWAGFALLLAGAAAGLLVARQVGPVETSAAESARKLRLAEARYASLWNDTPESLFVVTVTPEGRFVFEGLNPAHERATGLALAAVAGKEPRECLPPEAAAAVTARYRACVESGEPWIYDEVLDLPTGRRHWQTCLAPVRDPESGRIVTLVGTARDVTADREARDQVERGQRLLQATLDALSAHVAILDGTGTVIAVNQAWHAFAASNGFRDPGHGIGTDYLGVCRAAAVTDARVAVVARGLAVLLEGRKEEFRSSYRCGELVFQMTAARFSHEGAVYVVVAHENVTDLMAARQDARDTARRLLSLQEEERQRIAADLHDSTAQHLAAIGLALMQVGIVAGDPARVEKALDPVWASLDEAQKEIRTLSFLLYPPGLRTHGLAASLRQLVGGFIGRTGIGGSAEVTDEVDGVPFEVQRSVLRVAQEALINVHRHAAASRVSVRLGIEEGELRLVVTDDGRGLRAGMSGNGDAATALGVGIPGMEARIRQFNGTLDIMGGEGGTTVRAAIPLNADFDPAASATSVRRT